MTDMAVVEIPIACIDVKRNDRTVFNEADLRGLAESIREAGLISPITVRRVTATSRYELVVGERRLRAHKLLDRTHIAAIELTLEAEAASRLMLQENVQRENLNPIEEAAAYSQRMETFGITDTVVAQWAGKSVKHVRQRLDLLSLRPDVQGLVSTGQMSQAHALCLVGLDGNRQGMLMRWFIEHKTPPTQPEMRYRANELLSQQREEESALFGSGDIEAIVLDWTPPVEQMAYGKMSERVKAQFLNADDELVPFPRRWSVKASLVDWQKQLIEAGQLEAAKVVGTVMTGLLRADLIRWEA